MSRKEGMAWYSSRPMLSLWHTCHLSTINQHCIAGAGLPIHLIGEVSWNPKRRRTRASLQSSLTAVHLGTVIYSAGIFIQSMGARNRVGIGLSYRPARLHRLAELIP
jgi:hypothetical protein